MLGDALDNKMKAENLLREIVSSGTNNYSVYGSLAVLSGKKGNIDEMFEYLTYSTKLNPKYAEGHFNLGIMYLKKGDFDYIKPSYYSDNGGASEGYSIKSSFLNT